MNEAVRLTETDLDIIDLVVSRFVGDRKPTPRRQLLMRFGDPDLLENLITRGLLRDVNRQAVSPNLATFCFSRNKAAIQQARQSLEGVLRVLRELYLESDEDRQVTPSEIEAKAQAIGRPIEHENLWLGLYFVQNYLGVIRSSVGSIEEGQLSWLVVDENILRFKDIDKAWETRMKQEAQWQIQRDLPLPSPVFQVSDDDPDTLYPNPFAAERPKEPKLLVFISHSSKDADLAYCLVELLKAALNLKNKQIRCTSVDGFRLPVGANTDDVLKSEVRESKAFIGLITPNSVGSIYVSFELGARWAAGQHLAPVLAGLGSDALQGPLKGFNAVAANKIAHLQQLLAELAELLTLELQPATDYAFYAQKLIDQVQRTSQPSPAKSILPRSGTNGDAGRTDDDRRLRALTRDEIIKASKVLKWDKELPKWTVVVEGRSFPVRPLAFQAAGLLPNARATTHQAVRVLKQLGFEVLYQNKPA